MTKSDIVDVITRQSGMKKKEVLYIIDNFLEKVKESSARGERIEIRGFGTFYRSEKKPRIVYSPIAGKSINVPAKVSMAFKASKATERQVVIEIESKGA